MSAALPDRPTRPPLARRAPNRGAANFSRAASDNPDVVGGLPLDSVESAVTAAVRLGYKVAQAQVDRSARIARRFRDAADEAAGKDSERKAVDATEQLIFKALMAGLGWFEGVAADPGHPLKRLATAEFRLLGSMFGLIPPDPAPTPAAPAAATPSAEPTIEAARRTAAFTPAARTRGYPQVKLDARADLRRAVRVEACTLATDARAVYPLTFYSEGDQGTITGDLTVAEAGSLLRVQTSAAATAGRYTAAICDSDGLQLGYLVIAL
jgi:hypothetical protein